MINNISLYQFKNFADEDTINFSKLNILYGSNGRGKSSILQSILVLAQTMKVDDNLLNLRLNGEFVNLERFEDVLCSYADDEERSFEITLSTSKEKIKTTFKAGNRPQLAELSGLTVNDVNYAVEEIGESTFTGIQPSETNRQTVMFLPTSDIVGLEMLKNVFYISADRRGPVNAIKRNDNSDDIGPGIHGDNLIQVLYRHPEIIKRLEKAMSYIFAGAAITLPSNEDADELKLLINSANGSVVYKPSNVGFGYSHVLPIIVQALLAPNGSILIVENPEAHLHPGAQSRFMKYMIDIMKERELQIFIETHSDHIINGARLAVKNNGIATDDVTIQFVSRDFHDDRNIPVVTQISIGENGSLSQYDDDFMDEWTKQSRDLLR